MKIDPWKVFDGKKYDYAYDAKRKSEAQGIAESQRRRGKLARVIKIRGRWFVYTRIPRR